MILGRFLAGGSCFRHFGPSLRASTDSNYGLPFFQLTGACSNDLLAGRQSGTDSNDRAILEDDRHRPPLADPVLNNAHECFRTAGHECRRRHDGGPRHFVQQNGHVAVVTRKQLPIWIWQVDLDAHRPRCRVQGGSESRYLALKRCPRQGVDSIEDDAVTAIEPTYFSHWQIEQNSNCINPRDRQERLGGAIAVGRLDEGSRIDEPFDDRAFKRCANNAIFQQCLGLVALGFRQVQFRHARRQISLGRLNLSLRSMNNSLSRIPLVGCFVEEPLLKRTAFDQILDTTEFGNLHDKLGVFFTQKRHYAPR